MLQVNEAFAAQFLSVKKELGLDNERTNVCGGAIALGHPLGTSPYPPSLFLLRLILPSAVYIGASGTRITINLVHMLHRMNKRYAIGSACIGGGQGIAVLLEKC